MGIRSMRVRVTECTPNTICMKGYLSNWTKEDVREIVDKEVLHSPEIYEYILSIVEGQEADSEPINKWL